MPRVNTLMPDAEIKDGDKLIGIDSESGRSTVTFGVGDLKDYFNETTLDGFRSGRILSAFKDPDSTSVADFVESVIRQDVRRISLVSSNGGTEAANSITAANSTTLTVGAALAPVILAGDDAPAEGDLIVIVNNNTQERDFGVVSSITNDTDSDEYSITLGGEIYQRLEGFTRFSPTQGYSNDVFLYKVDSVSIDKDLILFGDILDSDGVPLITGTPVSLAADNTFEGENTFEQNTAFESQITIGDGGVDTYVLESPAAVPSNNQILAIDTSDNNIMKFRDVGELIEFSDTDENAIVTWAEGNNTDTIPDAKISASSVNQHVEDWAQDGNTDSIPNAKIPAATSTLVGGIVPGTNLSVSANGTLNASGTVGTIAVQQGGTEVAGAANTLNYAGTGVSVSGDGSTATVTINSANITFGSASGNVAAWAEGDDTDLIPDAKLPVKGFDSTAGNVATWAEGDDTSEIPATKLTALEDRANTWTENNTFENRLRIGDTVTYDLPSVTTAPTSGQVLAYPSSGSELEFISVVTESGDNTYTGTNTFGSDIALSKATASVIDTTLDVSSQPTDGTSIGENAYIYNDNDLIRTESRFRFINNRELGEFRIHTGIVGDDDTYSSISAFIINRDAATIAVPTTVSENLTLSKNLTVTGTSSFTGSIAGAITQVVNNRLNTQNLKIWHGTEAQYAAIGAGNYDANTIYITT